MRKTKRPVLLPIVPKVRAALDMCRKRTVMTEYVLLTPEGRPYSESMIKRYFKTAKAIAGITRRFRFHDQRHSFASTLASKGINSFTLRDLLDLGYAVELTQQTRDGGVDLFAVRSINDISLKFVIEANRHSKERRVGIGVVQRLWV